MSELKNATDPVLDTLQSIHQVQTAQLVVLMRLYDIGMASLSKLDEATANDVYSKHESGSTFGPDIWIKVEGDLDE